jgi:pimeloyl-ACP methyl ester carboxylesterase
MKAHINGIDLAYSDKGQGLPLVLVHAFPFSQAMWKSQMDVLAQDFRIITVDLRGHGESDAPFWRYTLEQFSDDLRGLLDHLGIDQAVLGGLSMGGYTLFAFYRKYAARVKGLILADTRAQADTEEGRLGRFAMAQVAYRQGAAAIADLMLPKILSPMSLQRRPELVQQIRTIIGRTEISGIVGDLMAMEERPDSIPMLKSIACPTLVIVGELDTGTPPADARVIAEGIKGARLEIIPGAAHMSNMEEPAAFNNTVRTFLGTFR